MIPVIAQIGFFQKINFNHGNDLVNYILDPRSIILPSFEWKNLTFQSETHCVLGERPQASSIQTETIVDPRTIENKTLSYTGSL